jgi:hypothetical protein
MQPIYKNYVSAIDIKMAEFDALNPKSASQQAEIAKYKRITRLRDKKAPLRKKLKTFWENF